MPHAAVGETRLTARAASTARRSGQRELELSSPPRLMGVLNVTPDSFSDGGLWLDPATAIERGLAMLSAGADLLDIGAESTRPGGGVYGTGAAEVSVGDELERLLPVLRGLRELTDVPLSVDTRRAEVAEVALAEGADLINDVSALGDPRMAAVVAEHGCAIVLMHSRGELETMQRGIHFEDLLTEVADELRSHAEGAVGAGIDRRRIVLDPGIGFGKTVEHNLALLRHLDRLAALGFPLLVGASRKSFIGALADATPQERLPGSLAAAAWAAHHRVAILRVHDVAATYQFLAVWRAIDGVEGAA